LHANADCPQPADSGEEIAVWAESCLDAGNAQLDDVSEAKVETAKVVGEAATDVVNALIDEVEAIKPGEEGEAVAVEVVSPWCLESARARFGD
jgi:hypothetical protein